MWPNVLEFQSAQFQKYLKIIIIFLKKLEYESIKTSEFPNKNDNPTNNPFTNKNPTIGIIKYRISLNPNIINDIKTHTMRNTDG